MKKDELLTSSHKSKPVAFQLLATFVGLSAFSSVPHILDHHTYVRSFETTGQMISRTCDVWPFEIKWRA